MPYIKSISIHSTVNQCLKYILNPDKTEDLLYTTSLNCLCDADEAYLAMKMIYEHYSGKNYDAPMLKSGKNSVKAIHYIQSFSPDDNVTPESAHRMAKAFARKMFGDDVQVVIATHNDKQHIHSHILINSYSVTGQKYYDNRKTREKAREYSDRVCLAFGIQPIQRKPGKRKSMKYNEWEHKKRGTSWKQKIRNEIDGIITSVRTVDELYDELEKRGYTIKRGNTPSIKAEDQQRFIRFKTLGDDYTEQSLKSRIIWKDGMGDALLNSPGADDSPIRNTYLHTIEELHILILNGNKKQKKKNTELPYLPNNDRDVYVLSSQLSVLNYDNIHSVEELEHRMSDLKERYESALREINSCTPSNTRLDGIIEQAEQYFELSAKQVLSEADRLRLNICRNTVTANNIHSVDDLQQLKNEREIANKKITALRKEFESCKKQYEVYIDIAATYRDIACGDYISKLMIAEKESQEIQQKNIDKKKGQVI